MRKTLILAVMTMTALFFLLTQPVVALEGCAEDDGLIPRGKISLETCGEYYHPQGGKGESFFKETVAGTWKGDRGGFGFSANNTPKFDSYDLEGFGFLNFGQTNFVLGYKYQDCGEPIFRYAFPGVEFFGKIYGFDYFLSFRNYFALEDGEDYFDALAFLSREVAPKTSLGVIVIEDHYWNDDSHEWLLVGGVARYEFSSNWAARLRLSRSWDFLGSESFHYDRARLTVEFHY